MITAFARFQRWPQACWLAGAFLSGSVLLTQGVQAQNAPSHERVSFYFAAHEDDWQLFMNPSAFQDVADPKTKTVFIHVTAGDAGEGMGNAGRKHPYYLARENGAERSPGRARRIRRPPISSHISTAICSPPSGWIIRSV